MNKTGTLTTFGNITDTIIKYYESNGAAQGLTTGWSKLDQFLLLQKGMLNIITGIPSSGKSEWLDQLMLQTIALHNWHWTVFSPENWPLQHHFQKLSEKWNGRPMFSGYNVPPVMSREEVDEAVKQLSGSIHFLEPPENNITIEPILNLLLQSKEEFSTDAFILDPWNELEHSRPGGMSETEYIGMILTKVRNFARRTEIDMFIVAHPTKLSRRDDGNYPVPTPYDISGSANWRNKADACVTVWRDYQKDDGVIQVHIQKIRNKNLGRMGCVELHWFKPSGLFFNDIEDTREWENHGIKRMLV